MPPRCKAVAGENCDPEYETQLTQQVCLEGAQLTARERKALVEVLETHAMAFSWHGLTTALAHEIPTGHAWPVRQIGIDLYHRPYTRRLELEPLGFPHCARKEKRWDITVLRGLMAPQCPNHMRRIPTSPD